MSAGLIRHLKRETEEDSNTRVLISQWEFDEKLVGKSLKNMLLIRGTSYYIIKIEYLLNEYIVFSTY